MQVDRKKERTLRIKVLVSIVAFSFAAQSLIAQPIVVTGKIVARNAETLPSASVQLLSSNDSTVIALSETNADGEFALRDTARATDAYIVKASFVGYESAYQNISVGAPADTLSVGTVVMKELVIELEEVTIASKRDPIVLKNDTIEYRMEAISTLPHANVETLLRQIPGLNIDRAGNVNAAGEPVTRIYINGKEVFGDNLKLVTKNLPADAVDKVQILDHKTDAERFSSSQSVSGEKAINIQLKENYEKMRFGSLSAGIGEDDRYTGEGKFNYFDERNQAIAVLKSNNINNIDFSSPGEEATLKPADGLLTTHSGAVNGFTNLSDKFSVNGSYHANISDNEFSTYITRQTFLPEGVGTFSQRIEQRAEVSGQQAVAGMQYKDSSNMLRITGSGNFSDLATRSTSTRESKSPDGNNGYNGQQSFVADNANLSGNVLLFFGHNFRKQGRTLTLDGQLSSHQNDLENENNSTTIFFDSTHQQVSRVSRQRNASEAYLAKITYTEPIGKRQQISGFYSVSDRASESRLNASDLMESSDLINNGNNNISSGYQYQRAGLFYQVNGKRLTFSAGTELQEAHLTRQSVRDNGTFSKTFENVLPHAALGIRLSDHTRLNVVYNTSVREPSVDELQPLESFIDPLNVYLPNLQLRPEYTHGLRLNFNTTDKKRKSFFLSASLKAGYTTHPIIQSVSIAEDTRRSTQFANTEESKNLAANFNISVPIPGINSTLTLVSSGDYRDRTILINQIENPQVQSHYRFDVEYSYSFKSAVAFHLSGYYGITSSDNPRLFTDTQEFLEMGCIGEMHLLLMERLKLSGVFHYSRLQNAAVNFDVYVPMLRASLEMLLFKNKNAVMSFSGNNLLDQSSAVTQMAGLSYIEQRNNDPILGRIFMIGFTYHFK